jgi:hypothetical protein
MNSKKKSKFLGNWFCQQKNLHGKKENFLGYYPNLAFVELTFPILINYSAGRLWSC